MFQTKRKRPAIAMIELIFAIVIMGIVLMSAPMLISTATKSGYVAVQQEAINEAASQVNMVIGYHWDKENTNEVYIPPILEVLDSNRDIELDEVNTSGNLTGRRLGTPNESYRKFVRADNQRLIASSLGSIDTIDTTKDDIDDFDGDTSLIEIEPAGLVDYVEDDTTIRINTAVRYIDDRSTYKNPTSGEITFSPDFTSAGSTLSTDSTNIKRITVSLTSVGGPDELKKEIILHAFSCNIGGYKLAERDTN